MTAPIATYDISGRVMAACCNCMTNGITLWKPVDCMHARTVKGRKLHYCNMCWSERKAGLAAVAKRQRRVA